MLNIFTIIWRTMVKCLLTPCPFSNWVCQLWVPSASTRIKSDAAAALNFQHPWLEFRVKSRNVLGENWQNRSSDRYFQEPILWAQFLYLLISRKALKILHGDKFSSWFTATLCKKYVHVLSLPPNHLYTDLSPLPLWSSFSELSEMLSPRLQPSFYPKLKLNLGLSSCEFFFKLTGCFLVTEFWEFFIYSGCKYFCWICDLRIFFSQSIASLFICLTVS